MIGDFHSLNFGDKEQVGDLVLDWAYVRGALVCGEIVGSE